MHIAYFNKKSRFRKKGFSPYGANKCALRFVFSMPEPQDEWLGLPFTSRRKAFAFVTLRHAHVFRRLYPDQRFARKERLSRVYKATQEKPSSIYTREKLEAFFEQLYKQHSSAKKWEITD